MWFKKSFSHFVLSELSCLDRLRAKQLVTIRMWICWWWCRMRARLQNVRLKFGMLSILDFSLRPAGEKPSKSLRGL